MLPPATSVIRSLIAPTGTLRCAVNMSNFLLVSAGSPTHPVGVSPSIAALLAKTLDLPLELVPYKNPALITSTAQSDEWDVCLVGNEPKRAEVISFTQAYCEIQASYLIKSGRPSIVSIADVDVAANNVVVSRGSAYGLWLESNLKNAQLHLTAEPGLPLSRELFLSDDRFDAIAGLRPWLISQSETIENSRVLDGKFTSVMQSVGLPKKEGEESEVDVAVNWLDSWVKEIKDGGEVAKLIKEFDVVGKLSVAD